MAGSANEIRDQPPSFEFPSFAIGPFSEIQSDALLCPELDGAELSKTIQIFRPQPHNGIGALLKIRVPDGDIQYRELLLLVGFGSTVKKSHRLILFQGYRS